MRDGAVAIVTGGGRGIGAAVVRALASAGAAVTFSTRSAHAAAGALVQELGADRVAHVVSDAAVEADVEALFDGAEARFGSVDLVVHAAGISRGDLLVSVEDDDVDAVLAVNAGGAFLVARRAVRSFVAAGRGGSLVMLGSLAQHGAPANAVYAASKGALDGLVRAIDADYRAHGVHAHLVVAGFVETELTRDLPARTRNLLVETCPQRRAAGADEIAAAVVALAGPAGAPFAGRPFPVTGGLAEIPA